MINLTLEWAIQTLEWAIQFVDACEEEGITLTKSIVDLCPMADVVMWARSRKRLITHVDLQEAYGVSRATAFRWIEQLREVQQPLARPGLPRATPATLFNGRPRP